MEATAPWQKLCSPLSYPRRIYEADAMLVPQPGEVATGIEAIRGVLGALLAMELTVRKV